MSDTSQGEGWWQASDQKWYPPETHPDYLQSQPPPPVPPPPLPPKYRSFWLFFAIGSGLAMFANIGVSYNNCASNWRCDESGWPQDGWAAQLVTSAINGAIGGLFWGAALYGLYRAFRWVSDKNNAP